MNTINNKLVIQGCTSRGDYRTVIHNLRLIGYALDMTHVKVSVIYKHVCTTYGSGLIGILEAVYNLIPRIV